jgi:hypothetical protein
MVMAAGQFMFMVLAWAAAHFWASVGILAASAVAWSVLRHAVAGTIHLVTHTWEVRGGPAADSGQEAEATDRRQ